MDLTAAGAVCSAGDDCAVAVDKGMELDLEEMVDLTEIADVVEWDVVGEDAVEGAIVNLSVVVYLDSVDKVEVDELKTSVGFRTTAELNPGRVIVIWRGSRISLGEVDASSYEGIVDAKSPLGDLWESKASQRLAVKSLYSLTEECS